MHYGAAFRKCLEECDVDGIRRLWRHVSPMLPQPRNDHEAAITIHMARTQSAAMPLKLRAYSHRWLLDRGLPSSLPDELRPNAERMYPAVVDAVGVSIKYTSPELKPVGAIVERAITNAIREMYADGKKEPSIVKARIQEVRSAELHKLFGVSHGKKAS